MVTVFMSHEMLCSTIFLFKKTPKPHVKAALHVFFPCIQAVLTGLLRICRYLINKPLVSVITVPL